MAKFEDLTATFNNRHGSAVTIHLITLRGENGLTVEPGYRKRYNVLNISEGSPF